MYIHIICIYIYIDIYIYVCICLMSLHLTVRFRKLSNRPQCIHIMCIYIYIYTYTYTCICICTCTCICICIGRSARLTSLMDGPESPTSRILVHMYKYNIYIYIYTYLYIYIHICIHIYIYIYTYVYLYNLRCISRRCVPLGVRARCLDLYTTTLMPPTEHNVHWITSCISDALAMPLVRRWFDQDSWFVHCSVWVARGICTGSTWQLHLANKSTPF